MTFRETTKYLIPIYITWFFIHIISFAILIITSIAAAEANTAPTSFLVGFPLLLISHFLLILIASAFWIWMIIDVAIRKFPTESEKVIWILIIVLVSILGAIIYFYVHGKKPLK